MEQSSNDPGAPEPKTPSVLNSTEISGKDTQEMKSITSFASRGAQIVTTDTDSNEPTVPYGFGPQLTIIPPSLNYLNLPPNPLKILAKLAVANPKEDGHDENYSPQSPEPSEPAPKSPPLMNLSTIERGETPNTTTDDNTFYSDDEPRRFFLLNLFPPPPQES